MSTAATETEIVQPAAEQRPVALPFRNDTFLGVFEAIGQDLGFNPNWLRVPFAALILWNPMVIIASYIGLGIVVAVTRWFFPASRKPQAPALATVPTEQPATVEVEKQEELLAA